MSSIVVPTNTLRRNRNLSDVTSAATARTNLGLGTGDTPVFVGTRTTYGSVISSAGGAIGFNTYFDGAAWRNINSGNTGVTLRANAANFEVYSSTSGANPTLTKLGTLGSTLAWVGAAEAPDIRARTTGVGYAAMSSGSGSISGLMAWYKSAGTRRGYMGYDADSSNDISMVNELGGNFKITGGLDMPVGTSLNPAIKSSDQINGSTTGIYWPSSGNGDMNFASRGVGIARVMYDGLLIDGNLKFGGIAGTGDTVVTRGATGPTIDSRAAGGFRSRTLDGSAAAPFSASTGTFSDTVTSGSFGFGFDASVGSMRVHQDAGYFVGSRGRIIAPSATTLHACADSGLKVRNYANTADAPITASTLTLGTASAANGAITMHSSVGTVITQTAGNEQLTIGGSYAGFGQIRTGGNGASSFVGNLGAGLGTISPTQPISFLFGVDAGNSGGAFSIAPSGVSGGGAVRFRDLANTADAAITAGAITASGHIGLSANNTYDIGSSTNYVRQVHTIGIKSSGMLVLNASGTGYGGISTGANGFWDTDDLTVRSQGGTTRTVTNADGFKVIEAIGLWGVTPPAVQPTTPVTLADVITILQSYGLCA